MADTAPATPLDGGNYEVLRARLEENARTMAKLANDLNERRKATFGGQELLVVGNERVRTEHNCVPRNIVNVNGRLLLGYNVHFALKREVTVGDVFSMHRCVQTEEGWDLSAVPDEEGLLSDPRFVKDFLELYQYYRQARLLTLRKTESKLLAVFRIGERADDVRVFRWELIGGLPPRYIDNRGERDHVHPPPHDFDWLTPTRDDHVQGDHPHVNIRDLVFVETIKGDLTIKVENNTRTGKGIYSEPVDDPHQSLDDAQIQYALVGPLVILSIRPFGETKTRFLVFNTRTHEVRRLDAIGQACLQLPEDHGLIFPGGYYLRTGQVRVFDDNPKGLTFKRAIRSPNGEDVLYIFHREEEGVYTLLSYNLIRQEVANPIWGHGYTLFDDGRLVIFRAESSEPTRVHPIQIWRSPFVTAEFAAANPVQGGFLAKIGNPELVRGISDIYAIGKSIQLLAPSRAVFEDLVGATTRAVDHHHWIGHPEVGDLKKPLLDTRRNAELIIDEFEKIQALKAKAIETLATVTADQARLLLDARPDAMVQIQDFMLGMARLREHRGRLITLRDVRLIDRAALDRLEAEVVATFGGLSEGVVGFLLKPESLSGVKKEIADAEARITTITRASDLKSVTESLETTGKGLELLMEVVGGLDVGDPIERTAILERISEVFGQLNRVRAILENKRRNLGQAESRAEFAAQFKLLAQGVSSALGLSDSPEKCDEQRTRLMVLLEELEGRFGEHDEFMGDLAAKRTEISDAFESKRQQLMEARQRRIEALFGSAQRILEGINRRARTFKEEAALHAWISADPMVLKLRQISEQLSALGDSTKAEDLLGRLKSARQDALRQLRDRADLYDGGADLIRLGAHKFAVNTQALDLTLVPRGDTMAVHLSGTGFYETVDDPDFLATRPFWGQSLVSETETVYRAEYLAAAILTAAETGEGGLSIAELEQAALSEELLLEKVRAAAAARYDEGYERGVHDADAAQILAKLLGLRKTAGLMRFPSAARARALLFWAFWEERDEREALHRQCRALARLLALFPQAPARSTLIAELTTRLLAWSKNQIPELQGTEGELRLSAAYLIEELAAERPRFVLSPAAQSLTETLWARLEAARLRPALEEDLRALDGRLFARLRLVRGWLEALCGADPKAAGLADALLEASVALLTDRKVDRDPSKAATEVELTGLYGQHPRISDRRMVLRFDELLARLEAFRAERVPGFLRFRAARTTLIERSKKALRLEELKARPMTSFVRNRLINEVYLPLVGNNLAKQLGAAGEGKRTDTMGMLLLISPPGYGKTTLMEYVAGIMGLVFVKVNGPSIGHSVHSLDPSEAPDATARQEVEKINLAFEMSENVMLYLDDIQHTHPELLQKFISLCDGTRRVEGVWRGNTRTYDLKGKKFCVVMAGNPYTETGARFQIPDMLANRADTYNLGDILGGREDLFALSYLENCLTSNRVLAPLAGRPLGDLYLLLRKAHGEEIEATQLSTDYSAAEISEIGAVLLRLERVRDTLLKVNAEYIRSAGVDDRFRTEPPFKLQGSYRNMAKMAEKVASAMNDQELDRLIEDHYIGESQTLTSGAENNLLKLAELRGRLSPDQAARWALIKKEFSRQKVAGGADDDPTVRVVGTLSGIGEHLSRIDEALRAAPTFEAPLQKLVDPLIALQSELAGLRAAPAPTQALEESLARLGRAVVSTRTESRAIADTLIKVQSALEAGFRPAAQPTPTAAPIQRAPTPSSAGVPWEPHLEIGAEADIVMRHAILAEVQRALVAYGRMQSQSQRQLRAGEYVLTGALPVMQTLARQVTEMVRTRLPAEQQDTFLDDLRRSIAKAIADLSKGTGEKIAEDAVEIPDSGPTHEGA